MKAGVGLLRLAAWSAVVVPCAALSAQPGTGPARCEALADNFRMTNVALSSAVYAEPQGDAPAHCEVRGAIEGNIKFAVLLPTDWNRRFVMVGNGGKAGSIDDSLDDHLHLGYASASTDTGHDNSVEGQSGAQFGSNPKMEHDFGYRAVHLTAEVSKAIIKAYYRKWPKYAYWDGCSTGGRQGLMEAQRFPRDFDGYIIGAPVNNYTGQQMTAPAYLPPLYNTLPNGTPIISRAEIASVGDVVYNGNELFEGCDARDGVVDGQLRDPRQCTFDVRQHIPTCDGEGGAFCLSEAQKNALAQVYEGKEPFVPGQVLGAENIPGGWSTWLISNDPGTPLLHTIIFDAFEWLMFNPDRPGFDYFTEFEFSVHPFEMQRAEQIYNATDPDLRDVLRRRSKIIMYHGWSDPGANPLRTVRYYESVVDFMDQAFTFHKPVGHQGADQWRRRHRERGQKIVDSFLRLYMIPGMAHCGGGTGHSTVDWLTPLADWAENRVAPTAIVGSRNNGASTRPHCPYPQVAVWNGVGDVDDAASFSCQKPADSSGQEHP